MSGRADEDNPISAAAPPVPRERQSPAGELLAARSADAASWASRITEQELPVFAQALTEISSAASDPASSAADLAQVITRDVSMSVRLLKIANSPLLNPLGRDIDTVSNAVVLMGFNAVRELALSLAVVEQMGRGEGRQDQIDRQLAHAFHTAAQGQALARRQLKLRPEEIFVAGLLSNVGHLAFWARERPESEPLAALYRAGLERETAERQVLGFTLKQLTLALAHEWRLGGLVSATLRGDQLDDPRCLTVRLADRIAEIVETHGWDSSEARQLIDQVAVHLGLPAAETTSFLKDNTEAALAVARRFGVRSLERSVLDGHGQLRLVGAAAALQGAGEVRHLPPAAQPPRPAEVEADIPDAAPEERAAAPLLAGRAPDPAKQFEALRDVDGQLDGELDLEHFMATALAGIHDGVGLDRVFYAALSPNQIWLRAKFAVGHDSSDVLSRCKLRVEPNSRSLFRVLLDSGKALWMNDELREQMAPLLTDDIEEWAQGAPFFAMPLRDGGRHLGLLYADRQSSGRALDADAFSSFRYFGDRIARGLARF